MPNRPPAIIDLRASQLYTRLATVKFASIGAQRPLDTQAVIDALPPRLVGPAAPRPGARASQAREPQQ